MSAISDMFSEGDFVLPIVLTEEQIQERQAIYFENRRKIESEDDKLANAKILHKSQVEPYQKENTKLYKEIKEGVEYKNVRAIEITNEDKGTIDYVDAEDTDVVLYSREMTPSEKMQYKIKFGRRKREALY